MKITKEELMLAGSFALLGTLFSMKGFIMFLDGLNPVQGLGVYYLIVIATLMILSYFGLAIFNIKINKFSQVLGATLIIFSFFIIFNWESAYVQIVTKGSAENLSNIFLGSEDGAVFWLWSQIIQDLDTLRVLTFIVTPAILSLLGGLLLEKKVNLSP
jgi:hypothetical protein